MKISRLSKGLIVLLLPTLIGACGATGSSSMRAPTVENLLNEVVVPPGATRLLSSVGILGTAPVPFCTGLAIGSRYWRVPHGAPFVTHYLVSHPTSAMSVESKGLGHVRGREKGYAYLNEIQATPNSDRSPKASLLYRYLSTGSGSVEMRVDAFVLSKKGSCRGPSI
jgi:hypothetical protein